MNILNLEAPVLVKALEYHGHTVLHAGATEFPSPTSALRVYEQAVSKGFVPDAAFFCDAGNVPRFPGMEALPCPTVFYSIDTFCNTWHMSYAHGFDAACVAQKEYSTLFAAENIPTHWLPLFAHYHCDSPGTEPFAQRDIPVAFVGSLDPRNIPDRRPFLEDFKRQHPLLFLSGDYVPIFQRSRIVLNQTAASEVNFRCFEAMACGAALLMEHSAQGLEELFTPGEHMLPLFQRGNVAEAAHHAAQALADPVALAALAQRGCAEVHARHMDIHRAQEVVTIFEELLQHKAPEARLRDLARRRPLVGAAYGMLADGLIDSEHQVHAHYFHKRALELLEH